MAAVGGGGWRPCSRFSPASQHALPVLQSQAPKAAASPSSSNNSSSRLQAAAMATPSAAAAPAAVAAPPLQPAAADPKLAALREALLQADGGRGVQAFIVPSEDPHMVGG